MQVNPSSMTKGAIIYDAVWVNGYEINGITESVKRLVMRDDDKDQATWL